MIKEEIIWNFILLVEDLVSIMGVFMGEVVVVIGWVFVGFLFLLF